MLACGQASKQAWPNSSPSARQTRQPDLRQIIRLMQSATPTASHTGSHASQGCSSMQHTARLPVSRPAWMTYRMGMAMARRGYLTLASSRRDSSVQQVQVIFESRQLQPDQPVERSYKLILEHDYNFTGWLSVVNFWSWLAGLPMRKCT